MRLLRVTQEIEIAMSEKVFMVVVERERMKIGVTGRCRHGSSGDAEIVCRDDGKSDVGRDCAGNRSLAAHGGSTKKNHARHVTDQCWEGIHQVIAYQALPTRG